MREGTKIRIWLVFGLSALMTSAASAQLKVGDDTYLNMNASASVGYDKVWDGVDSDSLTYGFNGNLAGYYHDPRFLTFTANPFLNQSNLNSTSTSNTLASGIYSNAEFLSGSKTPMQFTYSRDYNRDSTTSLPGVTTGYVTHGNGQGFSASGSYLPDDWPTLSGSFSHSSSDYEVEGQKGTGRSHTNIASIGTGYNLWQTLLSASYNKSWLNSETPLFGSEESFLNQNTTAGTFLFSATHPFGTRASIGTTYSRSTIHGDYADTNLDSTYNNLSANATLRVTNKLNVASFMSYSSDLSGSFFTNIISGTGSQKAASGSLTGEAGTTESSRYTSSFLNYGASAGYQLIPGLSLVGRIDHRIQGQGNGLPDFTSTTTTGPVLYTHKVWGGGLGLSASGSYNYAPLYTFQSGSGTSTKVTATQNGQTSFVGESASASYSHMIGAWSASVSGNYSYGLTTILVGYTQTSYGGSASLSRSVKNWAMTLSSSVSKGHVDASSLSDTRSENFSGTLTHRNFNINGSYGTSQGNALQVGGSIIPVPGSGTGVAKYLIQYNGETYGLGIGWRPRRRWTLTGNYSYLDYGSLNPLIGSSAVHTHSRQITARSEYGFRQMFFYAGFGRVDQGSNHVGTTPYLYNTFYFGINRYFNFF